MSRPPLGAVVVVLALVGGALVTGSGDTAPQTPTAHQVEVVGATAVCPDLRQIRDRLQTRMSIGAAPLPEGRKGSEGSMTLRRVDRSTGVDELPVKEPGQVAVGVGTTTDHDGMVVSASGELAAGIEVEQVTRGERGADRGLAGVRCDPPQREAWFVGGATTIGDETNLVLANSDDTPSTVDVSVFSGRGPLDQRLGQGITVPAHSRKGIPLDTLAPNHSLLAVHVQSRRGRVAAALRHSWVLGPTSLGVDWVPQVDKPATRVVVPGFPKGPGHRVLMVTNPGTDDTTVSVQVTTSDGQFVPAKMDALQVPAGTTKQVPLEKITDESALAVVVTSDGAPVLAGGFVQDVGIGSAVRDLAYTGGTLPLSGPALLTDLIINRPTESTLILTALDAKAVVRVTPIRVLGTVGGLPAPRTIEVPAGRTTTFRLSTFYPPGTETRLAVEVLTLPDSGPVYVARYLRERGAHGPLVTLLDLKGPANRVPRPSVHRDPRIGS